MLKKTGASPPTSRLAPARDSSPDVGASRRKSVGEAPSEASSERDVMLRGSASSSSIESLSALAKPRGRPQLSPQASRASVLTSAASEADAVRPEDQALAENLPATLLCPSSKQKLVEPTRAPDGKTYSRVEALKTWRAQELRPDLVAEAELAAWEAMPADGRTTPPLPEDPLTYVVPRFPVVDENNHLYELGSLLEGWRAKETSPLTNLPMGPQVRYDLRIAQIVNPELVARIERGEESVDLDLGELAKLRQEIKADGRKLADAPACLREDPYSVRDALATDPEAYSKLAEQPKGDAGVLTVALQTFPRAFLDAPQELRKAPEIRTLLVQMHEVGLALIPEAERTFDLCKQAVTAHGKAINHCPAEERKKPELGLAACAQTHTAYPLLVGELQERPEIRTAAAVSAARVSAGGRRELIYLATELGEREGEPREVVRKFLKKHAKVEAKAQRGAELTGTEELIAERCRFGRLALVKEGQCEALLRTYPAMFQDRTVFRAAMEAYPNLWDLLPRKERIQAENIAAGVRAHGAQILRQAATHGVNKHGFEVLRHLAPVLKDPQVARELVAIDGMCLRYLPPQFRQDPEIVRIAVEQNGRALRFAHKTLRRDEEIVRAAVKQDGRALRFAAKKFRTKAHRDIALLALKTWGAGLQWLSRELRYDPEMCRTATIQHWRALQYVPGKLRGREEIFRPALAANPLALGYCTDHWQADEATALDAIARNALAIRCVAHKLIEDDGFLERAVAANPRVLRQLSPGLQVKLGPAAIARTPAVLWTLEPFMREDLRLALPYVAARASQFSADDATMRSWVADRHSGKVGGVDIVRALLTSPDLTAEAYAELERLPAYQRLLARNVEIRGLDGALRRR